MITNAQYSGSNNSEQISPIPNGSAIGVTPLKSLAKICQVGIMPESLLAEAKAGALNERNNDWE